MFALARFPARFSVRTVFSCGRVVLRYTRRGWFAFGSQCSLSVALRFELSLLEVLFK